jgi:hypothetical protein
LKIPFIFIAIAKALYEIRPYKNNVHKDQNLAFMNL